MAWAELYSLRPWGLFLRRSLTGRDICIGSILTLNGET